MNRYCEIRERRLGFSLLVQEDDKTIVDTFVPKNQPHSATDAKIQLFYDYINRHQLKRFAIQPDLSVNCYIWSEYVTA